MAHNNNASQEIKAGQQLDKAVEVAKEYAKKHPNTLVFVTADHETGRLALEDKGNGDESGEAISKEDGPFHIANSNQQFNIDWTTSGHTSVDVPLSAMGRGANLFSGFYENTHVHDAVKEALGLK